MRRSYILGGALALLACGAPSHAQAGSAAPAPVVAVPAPAPPARPPIDSAKEKVIRQLLDVTGTVKLSQQMMDQMLTSMQTSFPGIPAEDWAKIQAHFKSGDLVTLIIPIYDKYYSKEELDGLLAFYQSPLGRKVIATLPQVQRESMAVGQAWGQEQARAALAEIKREKSAAQKSSRTKATTL